MPDFNNIFTPNFTSKYANALTQEGENFIKKICKGTGTKMISGNNGRMPYTFPAINTTWTARINRPTNNPMGFSIITTGEEYAEALIYWFNKYAEEFGLDANVVAAQAFCESRYRAWIYVGFVENADDQSTASGISQFLMSTVYGSIISNPRGDFTQEEINKIIVGLNGDVKNKNNYFVGGNTNKPDSGHAIAWSNRPILHQNIINNPDIMIKAQCSYLKFIANKCNALTSSTLFGYSRGDSFAKKSYLDSVNACKSKHPNDERYVREGLVYVLKIFGVLGDKNNLLSGKNGLGKVYKPYGIYFGYDEYYMANNPKNLKLYDPFNPYNTTLG